MTDTITLEGVSMYYCFNNKPVKGYNGKGLFYEVTLGLTKDHVDQLLAEGVNETVTNPSKILTARTPEQLAEAIMPRFREKVIKRAGVTLDYGVTLKRKVKDSDRKVTEDATKANNPIRAKMEGKDFDGIIGDGSIGDVTILLQRTENGTNMHIGSIDIVKLVEFKKEGGDIAVEAATKEELDALKARVANI